MKDTVIVRQCRSHRVLAIVFSLFLLGGMTALVLPIGIEASILYLPLLVILVPMDLYFFTWQIRLEPNAIVKKLFFRQTHRYTYGELEEVVKRYSLAERDHTVIMIFKDKKTLSLRMRDEGYSAALRKLQHHRSILTK